MDLLKTLLIYMSLVFTTSVQTAPVSSEVYQPTPEPTAYVAPATATPKPTPKPTPVPTIDITPNPAYKTIQMGDNGDRVRELQEKLAEHGYYDGEIDGRFGNQTRRAVEQFQYQHGLSADGIAGRRTLTVLYESSEIRRAPQAEPTAEPTPESQLSVALTPPPVEAQAFQPITTVAPEAVPEPTPTSTAAPTEVPAVFQPMSGYAIYVDDSSEALQTGDKAVEPYSFGSEIYLPLMEVLRSAGMNVLTSETVEKDEFAFAAGDRIIRIAYAENQKGEPTELEAFVNSEAQVLPNRTIYRVNDLIYLPESTIESLTGITTALDEANKAVRVTIAAAGNE